MGVPLVLPRSSASHVLPSIAAHGVYGLILIFVFAHKSRVTWCERHDYWFLARRRCPGCWRLLACITVDVSGTSPSSRSHYQAQYSSSSHLFHQRRQMQRGIVRKSRIYSPGLSARVKASSPNTVRRHCVPPTYHHCLPTGSICDYIFTQTAVAHML